MNQIKRIIEYGAFNKKYFSFLLIGKFSKKIFGIQFNIGHFVFQFDFAYKKFGIFNERTFKWVL